MPLAATDTAQGSQRKRLAYKRWSQNLPYLK